MSIEKIREEFEAWFLHEYYGNSEQCRSWLRREKTGEYMFANASDRWVVWQASRAAAVVELPTEADFAASDDAYFILGRCQESIEAAGLEWRL